MSEEMNEYIVEERKFLHELSNNLSIGYGMTSIVLKKISPGEEISAKEYERLEKGVDAITRMIREIEERRIYIKSQQI